MTVTDNELSLGAFFGAVPSSMPGGNTPWAARYGRELREILVRQASRQPRNLQMHLGPSEIGSQCLSGETEVVTRQGIRKIRDLAKDGSAELLIPMLYKGSDARKRWGRFTQVPVECFGEQELYEITLRRNQDRKTVLATADHHWYRSYWSGPHQSQRMQQKLETRDLRPGHRLQQLRRARPRGTTLMPVAIAQGFVFGDGTKGSDSNGKHRPATLTLYHNGKDEALLPFFPGEHKTGHERNHAHSHSLIRGLPRFWKRLPPLDESSSFLMSWLAGYFAADGCVTEDGHCAISSAYRENLEFVRNVAAICGIGYGQVQAHMRCGASGVKDGKVQFTTEKTPLYRLSLRRRDLPDWFFLIPRHAERARIASLAIERDPFWIVESVEPTGHTELVYCAITGDPGAFALADDLMTGNCDRQVIGRMTAQRATNHVTDPWPSVVGTAVHAWLADAIAKENILNGYDRWIPEREVVPVPAHSGHADLYDKAEECVTDWKVLGPTSLAKIKSAGGPGRKYVVQLLLYAMGYRNLGYPVRRVVLAALPRAAPTLDSMYCWERPYTPDDDLLVSQVLAETDLRAAIARRVLAGQVRIEDVPITPSPDCAFCKYFRPQSAKDGGPGCPGHSPPY